MSRRVMQVIGEPVFLLGHSYGAQAALVAAAEVSRSACASWYSTSRPGRAPSSQEALARLEEFARAGDWDGLAVTFFRDRCPSRFGSWTHCGPRSSGRQSSPMRRRRWVTFVR